MLAAVVANESRANSAANALTVSSRGWVSCQVSAIAQRYSNSVTYRVVAASAEIDEERARHKLLAVRSDPDAQLL